MSEDLSDRLPKPLPLSKKIKLAATCIGSDGEPLYQNSIRWDLFYCNLILHGEKRICKYQDADCYVVIVKRDGEGRKISSQTHAKCVYNWGDEQQNRQNATTDDTDPWELV